MDLVRLPIDTKTGKIAPEVGKGVKVLYFKKGTEPKETAPEKGQVDVNDFMMGAP
jgi:penicillin-binding protein 1A